MARIVFWVSALIVGMSAVGFANAAVPTTCSAYTANCIKMNGTGADEAGKCRAAGASCMQTGTFVAPRSGRSYPDMTKK
jgi:hypothetical protein